LGLTRRREAAKRRNKEGRKDCAAARTKWARRVISSMANLF
jgi:hypothetical protein